MKTPRLLSLCVAFVLSAPALASAQDEGIFTEENAQLITTIGVLSTSSTIYMLIEAFSDRLIDKMFENVSLHIKENAVALQSDIATGGGDALVDLGHLYKLTPTQMPGFLRRARAQRAALRPMLRDAKLTRDDVLHVTRLLLTPDQCAHLKVRPL